MTLCDGDQLVACYVDPHQAIDCAASGLECVDSGNGSVSCAIEACDPETTEPVCDGSAIVECSSGLLMASDCALLVGMTCVEVDDEPTCVGNGLECDPDFQDHCEGTVVMRCESGYLAEVDCESLHPQATCGMINGGPSCLPEIGICDPRYYEEICQDGVIKFCNMGKIDYLDCEEFGGSDCAEGEFGGRVVARCLP